MADHSSKARISPGKPLPTTQLPTLTPQFNHSLLAAPDNTTNKVSSDAVVIAGSQNHKKLIS